uniref:Protein kinase domain-containing protein n=1 Tax=Xenopus tropicalis TaxID=8364 RepID=A0A803J8X3_XENTR
MFSKIQKRFMNIFRFKNVASTCTNIKAAGEEFKPLKGNELLKEKIRVRQNEIDELATTETTNRKLRNVLLRETIKNQDKETQEQLQRQTEQRSKEKERWMSLEKEAQEENKREMIKHKERNMLLNEQLKALHKETEVQIQRQTEQRRKEKERLIALEKSALEENTREIMKHKQRNLLLSKSMETEKQKKLKKIEEERRMKKKARKKMASPYCQVVEKLDLALNMKEVDSRMVEKEPPCIEDFQLQSFLGEGSFGKVYKAQHRETGKLIALKTLVLHEMNDNYVFKCVALEQRILRLGSERQCLFLSSLVCSFQTEHYMCLGMDYAEGGNLESYLTEGALPLERVRFYSACIVLGLQFLHEHNIAHRDVKPENVLLYGDGYAKLADFGLCQEGMAYDSINMDICGTLPFMAPELLRGHYSRSVDWWALGVTMYILLTGNDPFSGANAEELLGNIITEVPDFSIDVTEDTMLIILNLLEENPGYRLGSGENGAEDVKNSPFFQGLDWEALEKKQIQAPFIPENRTTEQPEGSLELNPVVDSKPLQKKVQWGLEELFYARSSSSGLET